MLVLMEDAAEAVAPVYEEAGVDVRLDDPGRGGMSGGAQGPDPAGGVLDDRQDEQAGAAQGDCPGEVAREQRVSLGAEEVSPGCGGVAGSCPVAAAGP